MLHKTLYIHINQNFNTTTRWSVEQANTQLTTGNTFKSTINSKNNLVRKCIFNVQSNSSSILFSMKVQQLV